MNADAYLSIEKTERASTKIMFRSKIEVEEKLCLFGLGFPQVELGILSALMESWIVKNILLSLEIFCFRQSS
jgi:hypothetical protein